MGAILKQLVAKKDIPEHLCKALQEEKRKVGDRGPRLHDLITMLQIALTSLPKVSICTDALDECLPKHLPELLESLRDIIRESPKTRLFLTGRPHVTEDIRRYFARVVVVPVSPNKNDIRSYLKMKLVRDTEPEAMNDGLRADILRIILEKTSDIFLLVSLQIEAILAEVTIRRRRKKLQEMTEGNGLGDAYTATLTRLRTQKGNKSTLGLKVLMWVLYSARPLKTEELRHALGVEPGSGDLDDENIPALRTLLAASLGLVTVEASSSTVRLVHFTLQEHLLRDSTLFRSSHSTIAEACLTYLNCGPVRDRSPDPDSATTTLPLLHYASDHWEEHTRKGMTESVKIVALRFLAGFDKHSFAPIMIARLQQDASVWNMGLLLSAGGFSGLHLAAFLGIAELVAALLETNEYDVNATDRASCTPLLWAAARGHADVVKVLLERGDVNLDVEDCNWGRTALHWAASRGHEGVFKVLLGHHGVNLDQESSKSSKTSLFVAASSGYEGIVKMLLEREEVNRNRQFGPFGMTLLSRAAYHGHEGVVRMLLQRADVNPNLADTWDGRTPLLNAAIWGHEEIVKMLLERNDVRTNIPNYLNETPLSLALSRGHGKIAEMIAERAAITSDTWDPGSAALLPLPAEHGGESVPEMELRDDNPNTTTVKFSGHLHAHQPIIIYRTGIKRRRLYPQPD